MEVRIDVKYKAISVNEETHEAIQLISFALGKPMKSIVHEAIENYTVEAGINLESLKKIIKGDSNHDKRK